jgi:hypothetical protein
MICSKYCAPSQLCLRALESRCLSLQVPSFVNLGVCILLRVLDQVQGFPSKPKLSMFVYYFIQNNHYLLPAELLETFPCSLSTFKQKVRKAATNK